jgi:large conductance mechanosensitive channel
VMPPIGLIVGGVNFTELAVTLKAASGDAPAVVLGYGKFLQASLDFIIVAFAVFLLIKAINTLKKQAEEKPAAPPAPSREEQLLVEIRDLLKAR